MESDLESIVFEWQRNGIELWLKRPRAAGEAAPFVLRRRWWGGRLAASLRRTLLRPRADGAYGVLIEAPAAG